MHLAKTFQMFSTLAGRTFSLIIYSTPLILLFKKEATCHFAQRVISHCPGLWAIMMSISLQNACFYTPEAAILCTPPLSRLRESFNLHSVVMRSLKI